MPIILSVPTFTYLKPTTLFLCAVYPLFCLRLLFYCVHISYIFILNPSHATINYFY